MRLILHYLGYFLRARSLDPGNDMVNLSLGLAYVHYGLKRQSTNRQYLLLQGQSFISQYAHPDSDKSSCSGAERYYNVGRLFQLLGISYLGSDYYTQALQENIAQEGTDTITNLIIFNKIISLITINNKELAFQIIKRNLII